MDTLYAIVWLFPIIFMIHDFEEIIFTGTWKKRYKKACKESKMKKVPFSDFVSTSSFSCAVAEEFIIFSMVTFLSCYFNNYVAWYGLFFAIVLHFVIHFVLSLKFRHYVPGLVTSIIFLPFSIYILYIVTEMNKYSWQTICLSSIIGFIIVLLNIAILHKMMSKFSNYLKKFAKES
ncbi:HXXEE domain-containing protein [Clostridium sporogenes]|uniref:HXXEE domain-containing protein n=1 Tax=Clostridium sporogenes TaxID=1509 RepID=UPI003DA557AB